jgi:hypothetical protein
MYGRIETVARDGVTYFTRPGRGGYRHGKKKEDKCTYSTDTN